MSSQNLQLECCSFTFHIAGFASDATPQWRLVQNLSLSCEENGTDFIPSELHALMKNEIFISGNGLLYRYTCTLVVTFRSQQVVQ